MTSDETYRTSSQYRLWSFTLEALRLLRYNTNASATEHVKAAIQRARSQRSSQRHGEERKRRKEEVDQRGAEDDDDDDAEENKKELEEQKVECLTVEEELKLVNYYCEKAMDLADFCSFPTNVKVSLPALCWWCSAATWTEQSTSRPTNQIIHEIKTKKKGKKGNSNSISETILPIQQSDDLSSEIHHAMCIISSDQDRKSLYGTQDLCQQSAQNDAGRHHCGGDVGDAGITIHVRSPASVSSARGWIHGVIGLGGWHRRI